MFRLFRVMVVMDSTLSPLVSPVGVVRVTLSIEILLLIKPSPAIQSVISMPIGCEF